MPLADQLASRLVYGGPLYDAVNVSRMTLIETAA
jgi:hypothetical protein